MRTSTRHSLSTAVGIVKAKTLDNRGERYGTSAGLKGSIVELHLLIPHCSRQRCIIRSSLRIVHNGAGQFRGRGREAWVGNFPNVTFNIVRSTEPKHSLHRALAAASTLSPIANQSIDRDVSIFPPLSVRGESFPHRISGHISPPPSRLSHWYVCVKAP